MSNKKILFVQTNNKFIDVNKLQLNNELDLEISDINYEDSDNITEKICHSLIPNKQLKFIHRIQNDTKPIDLATAVKLKRILIGSSTTSIGPEWVRQYFDFEDQNLQLWYGLVQHKGGPCGVLASIQAYLCVEFFHNEHIDRNLKELDLNKYRNQCLSRAIGNILWQIGNNHRRVFVVIDGLQQFIDETKEFCFDTITERLRICQFHSNEELNEFLNEMFNDSYHHMGCVSFVYSCILTRGLEQIQQDFDFGCIQSLLTPETLLCNQELINLCLIGRAVSNVFDNNFHCDDLILQGITKQSTIGFLTLHEFNGETKVGSCYKSPKLQIYLILCEAHFTVLFSKDKIIGKRFQKFYYYDGLMSQDKEILLTIDTQNIDTDNRSKLNFNNNNNNNRIMTPLECVIKTKWPNCKIDWNDSLPLF